MRTISLIIVHCSAVKPNQKSGVKEIDVWHRQLGYLHGCGYHYVVRRDGTVETGRPVEMKGAHCYNRNKHSIGVCYEGGLDASGKPSDTRTDMQKIALRKLIEQIHHDFPHAYILGHNVLTPHKACPCFNAAAEYADLQPADLSGLK